MSPQLQAEVCTELLLGRCVSVLLDPGWISEYGTRARMLGLWVCHFCWCFTCLGLRNLRWMNKVPFFRDFSLHIADLEETQSSLKLAGRLLHMCGGDIPRSFYLIFVSLIKPNQCCRLVWSLVCSGILAT